MKTFVVKSIYLLLTICTWVLLPQIAQGQSETARQQIQNALQKADTNFQHQDVNGCLAMLTDDFQGTDIHGTRFNKSQTGQSLIKEFTPNPFIRRSATIKSQVLDVMSTGHRASVTCHERLVITIAGETTHERHVLTLDADRRSTWVQEKDRWREQSEKQITSRITQDGVLKSLKNSK